MRINYNVSAAIANKHLLGIENNLGQTMERLSSGLKINHSKDNPAGMAISNKMQAQIDGLDRASKNASDGISVIQIADGALSEVTSILQRMRELSVQAANDGTMSLEDKEAVQAEIDSLKDEINRISTDTEYNSKTLLDGSLDTRVYAKSDGGSGTATRVNISDYVTKGNYELTVKKAATQAGPVTATADYTSTTAVGVTGTININGSSVEIDAEDTYAEAFEKIRVAAEIGETEVSIDEATGAVSFSSAAYGRGSSLEISFDDDTFAAALGFDAAKLDYDQEGERYIYKEEVEVEDPANPGTTITVKKVPSGKNAEIELTKPGDGTGFQNTATVATDGNKIKITDAGGFSVTFLLKEGYAEGALDADGNAYDGKVNFEVTDIGTMTLHVGANMDQNMKVRIPEVSSESLFIDDLDVTTVSGADRAMTALDEAIAQVSDVRSRLGAYENRLDYTTESLDAFEENMTSAISRLTDADMAEEMTEYTHQNVLNQAAISVLTQANDLPQQVLQILQ